MTKQNLFTEEELAKVTDEAERKHLIECAQDQSKIDMKYMEIMSKYDLWEKGKRSRYFHATTHERTCDTKVMGNCPIVPLDRLKKKNTRKEKNMSRPTKTCYDCKNAYWDSVPYGSTTATMFGGCDKAEEMTEEEADRFGETEDCPFWENKYKEENA